MQTVIIALRSCSNNVRTKRQNDVRTALRDFSSLAGRGSRIRTCDLKYPKLPRYQAALYPAFSPVWLTEARAAGKGDRIFRATRMRDHLTSPASPRGHGARAIAWASAATARP